MSVEKINVLLTEDDPNLGMLLREYLNAKGYETTLAVNGKKGYEEFAKGGFDIAILDVMMPVKDGFTLAQEIRQTDKHIPIIFLTAKSMKDD
ncbi:MAG: two-component system OmpR family response regulator, partial [Alteromonas macleodii]